MGSVPSPTNISNKQTKKQAAHLRPQLSASGETGFKPRQTAPNQSCNHNWFASLCPYCKVKTVFYLREWLNLCKTSLVNKGTAVL